MQPENQATADSNDSAGIEVAVLDADGVIVAVNGPWTDFCEANNGNPVRTGIGVNYLEVCRRAEPDPGATEVAEAIEAALSGAVPTADRVLIECHSPHEKRWYRSDGHDRRGHCDADPGPRTAHRRPRR